MSRRATGCESRLPVEVGCQFFFLGWGPTALFGPFTSVVTCLLAVYPTYYMILKLTLNKGQSGGGFRSAPEVDAQGGGLAGCG